MDKIEILLTTARANEQSLISACESYPVPTNDIQSEELERIISRVREMKEHLPHGKCWAGARRMRTWCVDILEEKKEEYLINTMKGDDCNVSSNR